MSGFGFAGFAAGLSSGLSTGAKLGSMVEDYQLRKVREQGIAEAKALQAAASPKVQDNGDMQNLTSRPQASADPNAPQSAAGQGILGILQQNAQAEQRPANAPEQQVGELGSAPQASKAPVSTPFESPMASGIQLAAPKRFNVNSKEFDDKAKADAYAKDQTPDMETFYAKTLVPRMKEKLMEMGRMDEAQAWEKYAEESKTKQNIKIWSRAFANARAGNYNDAAQDLMKLYPDYDDGVELVEATPQKGPNGVEGFLMRVRDKDGNERSVFHDSQTIAEEGLAQLNPIEAFKMRYASQAKAKEMEAKEKIDQRDDERNQLMKFGLEAMRQGGQNSRLNTRLTAKEEEEEKRRTAAKERDASKEAARNQRLERSYELKAQNDAKKLQTQVKKGDSPEQIRVKALRIASGDAMWQAMDDDEREASVNKQISFINTGSFKHAAPEEKSVPNPVSSTGPRPGMKPLVRNGQVVWVPVT